MSEFLSIIETDISGLKLLQHAIFRDDRGQFSRVFCRDSLSSSSIDPTAAQINFTFTKKRGCLRGLHYQVSPHSERKIIACVRGAIFDVVVDLRHGSKSFLQWRGFELAGDSGRSLIVPAGFAHGFIALTDEVEMLYIHDHPFVADAQRGIRYNDPAISIAWPIPIAQLSQKDADYPVLPSDFVGLI